jgi:Winged helix DNA-binding domain
LRRSSDIIAKALTGHRNLTRTELRAELERARVKADGSQRLSRMMMEAEVDGIICSGPMRGKQFTYALIDERAPARWPQYDRDEALGQLARRYFATRSPATAHDFGWWSGLTMGDARRAIAAAGTLREWSCDGRSYWIDESSVGPVRKKATAHLLPNYDEYFIGYRDRNAIGTRISNIAAVTGGNALIAHVAFIDGLLVGGWRRRADGDTTVIDIKALTPLTPAERRRLEVEGKRFAAFLGKPVEMRWAK